MKIARNIFESIIEPKNLFSAWHIFQSDKKKKPDVLEFGFNIEENIFQIHRELKEKIYKHGPYSGFHIHDPKKREIHKAIVRDRVVHHAIFQKLNPVFEQTFINDSYSCRVGKGTHKGVVAVEKMMRRVSKNYTEPAYALKCDIRKFFDSVDQDILISILDKRIKDADTMWLLKEIIGSYKKTGTQRERERDGASRQHGIPIGNLTSQIFANIYMNEFDQFVKHELRVKQYARYTDDFIIVSGSQDYLKSLLPSIQEFLRSKLRLELHPAKVTIRKFRQGIDFLGYIILPHYRLVRTKTKKRILRKIKRRTRGYQKGAISKDTLNQSFQSYLGVLSHANTHKIKEKMINDYWLNK